MWQLGAESTLSHGRVRGRGKLMIQVIEKGEEFFGGEMRRHGDIRHGPLFSLSTNPKELPLAIDPLRLH